MIDLKNMLGNLMSQHGLLSLKAGTEWENMDYSEIAHLLSIYQQELPILVKVAGPEAKTDLRHLREMGVDSILGPMIESEYALEKFVLNTQQSYEGSGINPKLAINMETIQGYHKLNDIISSPYFQQIDTVVIGRLDLSLSMQINDVDHPDVVQVTKDLASRVSHTGKHVSIGGFVNPSSANDLKQFDIDRLSTVHLMFDLNKVKDVTISIWKGLEFEIAYYQSLIQLNPERTEFYQSRIATSQTKLDKAISMPAVKQFIAA